MTDAMEKEPLVRLQLSQVKPEHVDSAANHVGHLIEKACAYSGGRFTLESVVEACAGRSPNKLWQMWIVFDPKASREDFGERCGAVAITCLSQYPTGMKVAEVILMGGKGLAGEWMPYVADLRQWAIEEGCDRMQFIGRRGFQRLLGDVWHSSATMYETDLKGEPDGPDQQRH